MEDDPVGTVLNTAELLECILFHVSDADLWHARLVSWRWFNEANRVLFRHCTVEKLNLLEELKTNRDRDYSKLVKSVFMGNNISLPWNINISNVRRIKIDVPTHFTETQLLQVRERCPLINRIDMKGDADKLGGLVPLCNALLPNVVLGVAITGNFAHMGGLLGRLAESNLGGIKLKLGSYPEGEEAMDCLSTLIHFPTLLPYVSGLALRSYPSVLCNLARWDHLGVLLPRFKSLKLDVWDHKREYVYTLERRLLQLVQNDNCIQKLHITIAVTIVFWDDWVEKLTENLPNLRDFRLITCMTEPLSGKRLFSGLKNSRNLQEVLLISSHLGAISDPECLSCYGAYGLDIEPFDQKDDKVWFPCLHTLKICSKISEAEFTRLVAHHMPLLTHLEIKKPQRRPLWL